MHFYFNKQWLLKVIEALRAHMLVQITIQLNRVHSSVPIFHQIYQLLFEEIISCSCCLFHQIYGLHLEGSICVFIFFKWENRGAFVQAWKVCEK